MENAREIIYDDKERAFLLPALEYVQTFKN
jgi:hypothetical protein